jgi:hypothetical protein
MKLTPDQKKRALELALSGASQSTIRVSLNLSRAAWFSLRDQEMAFFERLEEAKREALLEMADRLLTAHADFEDTYKARLFSDNLKWLLSKRIPAVFGDRLALEVVPVIDLRAAIEQSRARLVEHENEVNDLLRFLIGDQEPG